MLESEGRDGLALTSPGSVFFPAERFKTRALHPVAGTRMLPRHAGKQWLLIDDESGVHTHKAPIPRRSHTQVADAANARTKHASYVRSS